MNVYKKVAFVLSITAAFTLFVAVVILISLNTHFLNFNIEQRDIIKNNLNTQRINSPDINKLVEKRVKVNGFNRVLFVPENFEISVFATGMDAPRFMAVSDDGSLFVTDKGRGEVLLIKNGQKTVIDSSLRNPHGIDLYNGDLYVAEEHQVVVYRDVANDSAGELKVIGGIKEVVVKNLPSGKGHNTRTIKVRPADGKLFVSIGSSCNVCEEDDKRRAAIVTYNLDGTGEEIYAEGLRNTVGFVFGRQASIMSVDNGRDLIGDNLPPEEINRIDEKGKHFGWPYCYGKGIVNPEFQNKAEFCKTSTEFPVFEMQAHSAPLGLNFTNWEGLRDNLFIAFHGSWNRTVPTGYKIVRVDMSEGEAEISNFITGWLDNSGKAWGRPVDVVFDNNQNMYISDDKEGVIYKVTKTS